MLWITNGLILKFQNVFMKMLTLLNIVLEKSMHLGFGNRGLISHFAGYLCDPGKLFSQNLFCQLSREHYNPSPPGLLQGLHKDALKALNVWLAHNRYAVDESYHIIIHSFAYTYAPLVYIFLFPQCKKQCKSKSFTFMCIHCKYIYKYKPLSA